MPTPRHLTAIIQRLRKDSKTFSASSVTAARGFSAGGWVPGVIKTADGNTAERYTVSIPGLAGATPASSSLEGHFPGGTPVWLVRVREKFIIVGRQ